jgi:serine/threonine protein kinase
LTFSPPGETLQRDLKPQNLLLADGSRRPVLKIADFGFARALQPQGLAETLCGSPLYMAPEILQARIDISNSSVRTAALLCTAQAHQRGPAAQLIAGAVSCYIWQHVLAISPGVRVWVASI